MPGAERRHPAGRAAAPALRPADGAPVVVVAGALAPYTHVLYEALGQELARDLGRPLHVLTCTPRETARQWVIGAPCHYRHEVLPGLRWHRDSVRNLYVNPAVAGRLRRLEPAALVLNDFSPTMLIAAAVARGRGIPYGVRTDGVPETDPGRHSAPHRLLRRAVVSGAAFGLGPSGGSRAVLERYGLASGRFGLAPLFPGWQPAGEPTADADRPHDLLFCGMLNEDVKGARFFTDVALACRAAGRSLSVRVVGDGPLRDEMRDRLAEGGVAARFDGFLDQGALAEAYASAHLFLFPSRGDVWGVVVQEALQSGTAVLASPHSGAARDLLAARGCGLVEPLDVAGWASAVGALLDDPGRRAALRRAGFAALPDYSLERAVRTYGDWLAVVTSAADPGATPVRLAEVRERAVGHASRC